MFQLSGVSVTVTVPLYEPSATSLSAEPPVVAKLAIPTAIGPVKGVPRVCRAAGFDELAVLKVAGMSVHPLADAEKSTLRENPAGAADVKVCATIGVAAIAIELRDEQKPPDSTWLGAERSVRSRPVEVSTRTPRSKMPPSAAMDPPMQMAGTVPITAKSSVSLTDCASALPAKIAVAIAARERRDFIVAYSETATGPKVTVT
jgi:hypothetical protein